MRQEQVHAFSRSVIALAVCAAFTGAYAQEKKEEAKSPVETRASVEAGVSAATGDEFDRAFWGQYNGMRNQDVFGILNFDYSRRDASTGTWLDIVGNNLGLQTREIGLNWTRQGDWGLGAVYDELWRVNPYTVNTAVQGTGTTTPSAQYLFGGPGSGGDTELSTKRKSFGINGSKWFGSEYQLQAKVSSENKTGAQLLRHRQPLSRRHDLGLQLHTRIDRRLRRAVLPAADRLQPHAGRCTTELRRAEPAAERRLLRIVSCRTTSAR